MNHNKKTFDLLELGEIARYCRGDILEMVHSSREGHLGGAFSCMEILTALYFNAMNLDPANPDWEERDRFILSKGHACFAQYAALAHRGFFPPEKLKTVADEETIFGGHPDREKVPGIEVSTGSLGHGLSIGAGMALAGRREGRRYRVFVVMGDGEIQEGSVWEAAMFAAANKLDNLAAVIDYNSLQATERVDNIIPLNPLRKKWAAFGWGVEEIEGHNMGMLVESFANIPFEGGKPSVIIAHTIKGKGVSFMENQIMWHARPTSEEEFISAQKEIENLV